MNGTRNPSLACIRSSAEEEWLPLLLPLTSSRQLNVSAL
jgi:hypothetical protein